MMRLELSIAWRYLGSRRGSRLLSFISVIAVAGVAVGVSALIVIIGVMNGLQTDLREKILVGSPDVRVLTYGEALRVDSWRDAMARVRSVPDVVDAAPFVISQGLATTGRGYHEAVSVSGILAGDSGSTQVTSIRDHAREGNFSFRDGAGALRGAVVGRLLADRLSVVPGQRLTIVTAAGGASSPLFGGLIPRYFEYEVTGIFETGMYEYDNSYVYLEAHIMEAEKTNLKSIRVKVDGFTVYQVRDTAGLWTPKSAIPLYSGPLSAGTHRIEISASIGEIQKPGLPVNGPSFKSIEQAFEIQVPLGSTNKKYQIAIAPAADAGAAPTVTLKDSL